MKKLFAILLFTLSCMVNEAQTKYIINGKCQIVISDKLEMQDSELNDVEYLKSQGGVPQSIVKSKTNRIVFQQYGLNANMKTAFDKYCRLMVSYYKEDVNYPVYRHGERVTITNDLIKSFYSSALIACDKNKTPLIKFNSPQALTINGFPAIYYSYKRKGYNGMQPPVIVNMYVIYNRYESAIVTFSYRETERELWKDINNCIVSTFSFTKVY